MYCNFIRRYFTFIAVFISSIQYTLSGQNTLSVSDSLALRALWNNLGGSSWQYPSYVDDSYKWFGSSSAKYIWDGLNWENGRVVSLDLKAYMVPVSGNVHYRDISKLTQLETLSLRDMPNITNFYADSIVDGLPKLKRLYFTNNNAKGQLPGSFFSKLPALEVLDLSRNQLSDTIPCRAIGASIYLTSINLAFNNFSGDLNASVLDMGSALTGFHDFNFNNNKLTSLSGSVNNFYYYPINFYANYNLISRDNGLISRLYMGAFQRFSYSYFYFDHNRLSNSAIYYDQPMYYEYYTIGNNYYTVLPQTLSDTIRFDIKNTVLPTALSINTSVPYVSDFQSSVIYINDEIWNEGGVRVFDIQGVAHLTVDETALNKFSGLSNVKIKVVVATAPLSLNNPSSSNVSLAPIILRYYEKTSIVLDGLTGLVCSQGVGARSIKYSLEALGVAESDEGSVVVSKSIIKNGIVQPIVDTTIILTNSDLLISKRKEYHTSLDGEQCTLTLKSVSLSEASGVARVVELSNVNNTIRAGLPQVVQVLFPEALCSESPVWVKVVKPEYGVTYEIQGAADGDIELFGDTLFISGYMSTSQQNGNPVSVWAHLDGTCNTLIASDTLDLVPYSANVELIDYKSPTCADPVGYLKINSLKDYVYTPRLYSSSPISELAVRGTGSELTIPLPVYFFPNERALTLDVSRGGCNIYMFEDQNFPVYISYENNLPVRVTDSLALINFVEKTGYNPTRTNTSWYGRSILRGFDASDRPIYRPLKDWELFYNMEQYNDFVQITCGHITGIDLNSDPEYYTGVPPIGVGKNFSLSFDSLAQLKSLNIAYNGFEGSFDSPNNMPIYGLQFLNVSNNNFKDPSFIKINQGLKNAEIYAAGNKFTFRSLLQVNHPKAYLLPQQSVEVDTTVTVYQGQTLTFVNPFPETSDGKLLYKWHRSDDTVTLSTSRDLVIQNVTSEHGGSYTCDVAHPDVINRVPEDLSARIQAFESRNAIQLEGMIVNVLSCPGAYVYAGPSQTVCESKDSVALSGTVSVPSNIAYEIKWTTLGTGKFASNDTSLLNTYLLSDSEKNIGSTSIIINLISEGGNCTSTDTLELSISPSPIVDAGKDSSICIYTSMINLTGSSSIGQINWSTDRYFHPTPIDTLSAQYNVYHYDIDSGYVRFIASAETKFCTSTDTVIYTFVKPAASDVSLDPFPLDSMSKKVMVHMINNNMPNQSGYVADDYSTWQGIKTTCGHITEIKLPYKNLKGTLAKIDSLYYLEHLDLSHNGLDSIGTNLSYISSHIQTLDLSHNIISYGRDLIMSDYKTLNMLNLSHNNFRNRIALVNYAPKIVNIGNNSISGFIIYVAGQDLPYEIRTEHLDISNNQIGNDGFYGFDSLVSLKHLDVSHNFFEGTFPSFQKVSSQLHFVDISHNRFFGYVPDLSFITNLDTLDLSHNAFEGSVNNINVWNNALNVKYLDFGNNRFYGSVSDDFSLLTNLQYFAIDSNVYENLQLGIPLQKVTSIPKFAPSLKILKVESNTLNFSHLAPNYESDRQISWFPQDSLTVTKPLTNFGEGLDYAYNANIAAPASGQTYQWYQLSLDNVLTKKNTGKDLVFNNMQKSDIGYYYAVVKYPLLGADSLITKKFYVNVVYCRLNQKDSIAMLSFYDASKLVKTPTFKETDPKTWPGIKIECENITEVRLPNAGLTGSLDGLDSLDFLQVLDLSDNNMKTVAMPLNDLSDLIARLRYCDLSNNGMDLKGLIQIYYPDQSRIYDTLNLSGNIVNQLYIINILPRYINLSHDSLTGLSLNSYTDQSKLEHLDVSHNQIQSPYIYSINHVLSYDSTQKHQNLKYLDISYNKLSNRIKFIVPYPALEHLDVSHNFYTGFHENTRLNTHVNLQYLNLGNNKILTDFDDDLTALNKLKYFAIDSNSVDHTQEFSSGITSLPKLPSNVGLELYVQFNHLDFEDLEPYAGIFNKNYNMYASQYDSVDYRYMLKPAIGTMFELATTASGKNTTYQWVKYIGDAQSGSFTNLSGPTANSKIFKKQFTAADTGTYSVKINNTDFPGLEFFRREIKVEACGFTYSTKFQLGKSRGRCYDVDTLSVDLRYTGNNERVINPYVSWFFNDHMVSSEERNNEEQLPLYVSGYYHYSVFDQATECSIVSPDTLISTYAQNPPVIQYATLDSTISNINNFSVEPRYQWLIDGLPIAGANEKSLRLYFNGRYQLMTISSDSCSTVSLPVDVNDFSKTFVRSEHTLNSMGQVVFKYFTHIDVYPNPASDAFTISGLAIGSKVTITNPQGHIVMQFNAISDILNIESTNFAKGVYLLNVSHQNTSTWEKIVIQ